MFGLLVCSLEFCLGNLQTFIVEFDGVCGLPHCSTLIVVVCGGQL
jgi:hypothetical protein